MFEVIFRQLFDAEFSLMTFYYLFSAQLIYLLIKNKISIKFIFLAYIFSLIINFDFAPLIAEIRGVEGSQDIEFQKQIMLAHIFWDNFFNILPISSDGILWRMSVANRDVFPVTGALILSLLAYIKYLKYKSKVFIPFIILGIASCGALFVSHFLMMTGSSYTYLIAQQQKAKYLPELSEEDTDRMFRLYGYEIIDTKKEIHKIESDALRNRIKSDYGWINEANVGAGGVYVAFNDVRVDKLYIKKDHEYVLNDAATILFNRQLSIAAFYWFIVIILAFWLHRKRFNVFVN